MPHKKGKAPKDNLPVPIVPGCPVNSGATVAVFFAAECYLHIGKI